jgi:hypothetical protein
MMCGLRCQFLSQCVSMDGEQWPWCLVSDRELGASHAYDRQDKDNTVSTILCRQPFKDQVQEQLTVSQFLQYSADNPLRTKSKSNLQLSQSLHQEYMRTCIYLLVVRSQQGV